MRIAFDLDGVLADLHAPFVAEARRLFPKLDAAALAAPEIGASPDVRPADPGVDAVLPRAPGQVALTPEQSKEVWRRLVDRSDFWEGLDECEPGVIARLADLAAARRWDVIFITSRPTSKGRTVQRQSQRWLAGRGFEQPSVYVVHGSRGRIAAALALDAVVDDRADNCLDVVLESRAGAVLVWRGDMGAVPASVKRFGIAAAGTVGECLDKLIAAEDAAGSTNFLDELRRLFGLRTKRTASFLRPALGRAPGRKREGG